MHPLEIILQLQVGSDQAAVLSLPIVVSSITTSHFQPSPHLQKWVSRVTSLIHSKHPGACWAGLCLALQTSHLSKELMIESAQNWIAITLPMLSRRESLPTSKACIRLLEYIFSSTVGIPEFQRQLATPNIPKFSAALASLAEKTEDHEIRHLSLMVLTHLIPLYPTLHRSLHPSLFSLSFRLLSGSPTTPTSPEDISGACGLHAVLHFTGGKVGAAPLWRKSLDTALANAWSAFAVLRTTFPQLPRSTLNVQPTFGPVPTDPIVAIPLSLDRLKCSISLINKLLRAVTLRPVSVSIGELNKLALCLLRCSPDEKVEDHFDASRRALEISVIPEIWKLGCAYISELAKCLRQYLTPHASCIISYVTHHLEKPFPRSHHILLLRVLPPLLSQTYAPHSPIPPTRLVKILLPLITSLLSTKSEVQQQLQETTMVANKKGKKRVRGYEGDEVFKIGRGVLCPKPEDGEIVEKALEALDPLLSNPHLSAPIRGLAARLLITLLLELPRHPSSAISPDPFFHGRVYTKVISLCYKHVLAGASGWINGAIGLVVNAMGEAASGSETVLMSVAEARRELDVLLHPRLPPLLRSLPPIEAISLLRSENTKEDKVVREGLGVATMEDVQPTVGCNTTVTPMVTNVTTVQQADIEPPTSQQRQSWTAVTLTPNPMNTGFVSRSGPLGAEPDTNVTIVPSTEVPLSIVPGTSIIDEPVTTATSKNSEPSPKTGVLASTSGESIRPMSRQDSDEEDEEMPEIDMRSDSD